MTTVPAASAYWAMAAIEMPQLRWSCVAWVPEPARRRVHRHRMQHVVHHEVGTEGGVRRRDVRIDHAAAHRLGRACAIDVTGVTQTPVMCEPLPMLGMAAVIVSAVPIVTVVPVASSR